MNMFMPMAIDFGAIGIIVIVAGGLAFVVANILFRWTTVQPWEHKVATRGSKVRVLEPGRYFIPADSRLTSVDIRQFTQSVTGQEIQTSDGIAARYWLHADFRVTEALRYVLETQSAYEALHRAMQAALRSAVRKRTVEAILANTATLEAEILAGIRAGAERVGCSVVAVHLLDVQLPSDLRRATAAIELERRVASASLERARGEIATLRALSNAARMIDENPKLESLRRLQVLESAFADRSRNLALHIGDTGV